MQQCRAIIVKTTYKHKQHPCARDHLMIGGACRFLNQLDTYVALGIDLEDGGVPC